MKITILWGAAALCAFSMQARESVCLKSGFCIEAESHMISDGMLVVQSGHGTVQFPIDQVDEISGLPSVSVAPMSTREQAQNGDLLDGRVGLTVGHAKTGNAGADSEELVMRAAIQEGLEPGFVRSVAMVESGLRQNALSPKGAIGLMQLMPLTAGQLGVDPTVSDQNARGGAAFLRQLLIKYNGDSVLALAAYNAGSGAVDKYKGVPPYLETRQYVIKVLREYQRQQRMQAPKTKPASLMETASK